MSEFRVIGVFGISGVGKSTLIVEAQKIAPVVGAFAFEIVDELLGARS
jgi:adenylate kinase